MNFYLKTLICSLLLIIGLLPYPSLSASQSSKESVQAFRETGSVPFQRTQRNHQKKEAVKRMSVSPRFLLFLAATGALAFFIALFLITEIAIIGVLASFVFTPFWCLTINWLAKDSGPEKLIRIFEKKEKKQKNSTS